MSRKQIQKLLKDEFEDEERATIEEVEFVPQQNDSCWDILMDEESDGNEEQDENVEIGENFEEIIEKPSVTPQKQSNKQSNKKNKKKNKKKKGKNNKKTNKKKNKHRDIDELLEHIMNPDEKAVTKKPDNLEKQEVTRIEKNSMVMKFDINKMNPANEFKSMFGDIDDESVGSKTRRKTSNLYVKPGTFVDSRDSWPPFKNIGLSLKLVKVQGNIEYYALMQSRQYLNASKKYQVALHSHDPNLLFMLYRETPYHLPTLIQISEIFKMQDNTNEANNFLEQAMYVLEQNFTKGFISALNAQKVRLIHTEVSDLEPSIFPNIMIYYVIAKRINACSAQGTHATALELSKLLLAMNPNDPCGLLLKMDFYMLQSGRFSMLEKYYSKNEDSLRHLPNWMFSRAIATLETMNEQRTAFEHTSDFGNVDIITDDVTASRFKDAFLKYPQLLHLIIEKAKWKVENWESKIRHTEFCQVHPNEIVQNLLSIYAEQMLPFFEKLESYLQKIIFSIIDVESDDPVVSRESGLEDIIIQRYQHITSVELSGKMMQPLLKRLHAQALQDNGSDISLSSSVSSPDEEGGNALIDLLTTLVMPWNRASLQTPSSDQNNPNPDIL